MENAKDEREKRGMEVREDGWSFGRGSRGRVVVINGQHERL